MEKNPCKKCTIEIQDGDELTVCSSCKKLLDIELRIHYIGSVTLVTLSLIIAITGVTFFMIGASRGGDASSFRVGSGRNNSSATPMGLFILSGFMMAGAAGMFFGAGRVKKNCHIKEGEYLQLTGVEPIKSFTNSYF